MICGHERFNIVYGNRIYDTQENRLYGGFCWGNCCVRGGSTIGNVLAAWREGRFISVPLLNVWTTPEWDVLADARNHTDPPGDRESSEDSDDFFEDEDFYDGQEDDEDGYF